MPLLRPYPQANLCQTPKDSVHLLCLIRHAWEAVGLATLGRGRLERCTRCQAMRRVNISLDELEATLYHDLSDLKSKRGDAQIQEVERQLALLRARRTKLPCPNCTEVVAIRIKCPFCGART